MLVVGSLVEDLISQASRVPNSGETVQGLGFSKAPGGKGANQAVQSALLGCKVDFVGKTGDDVFSIELVNAVRSSGINTTKVLRSNHSYSGVSAVSIETKDGKNNNRILMNPGANFSLSVEDVSFLEECIDDYDYLVLQFEIPLEVNKYLAKLAHKHGVTVIVNPAPSKQVDDSFLQDIDYLVPNEHEAHDLSGVEIHKDGLKVSDSDITRCSEVLLARGVKNVIITLGEAGSVLVNKDEIIKISAVKNVKVVDPTAAGDSFLGAFVAGLAKGLSKHDSLLLANYVSSLTVTKLGALPSLTNINDVKEYVKKLDPTFALLLDKKIPNIDTPQDDFNHFKDVIKKEANDVIDSLHYEDYAKAVQLILDAESNANRVHITGIGKPSHVAEYFASLLSSTGTPTYYLHGTEAVHGSCGQLVPGDVVIAISNSGETGELKATLNAVKRNHCHVIGVSGNKDSWLAKNSDAFLLAHIGEEGGPINKAPRASINAEILVLQGLSVILQAKKKISPEQYVMWHPGGKLGESISNPHASNK